MRRSAFAAFSALGFLGFVGVSCGGGSSTGDNTTPTVQAGGSAGDSSSGSSGSSSPGSGGSQSNNPDASTGNAGGDNTTGGAGSATAGNNGTGGGGPTDAALVSDVTCANSTAFESFGVVMVATTGGDAGADAGACGTKVNPCTSIQVGIDAAAKAGKQYVYVAVGTYNEDNIALAKGVSVSGGWNTADWTRGCPIDAGATVIRNITGNKVISATDLGGAAALDSLTLKSKVQSAVTGDGESLYGVFAKGATTSLTLANVKIELANGGRGANGGAATDPAAAPATPGACPANTTPATMMGAMGSDGLGAVPASFGPNGFVSTAGKDATSGLMGGDGTSSPGTKSNSCGGCSGADATACGGPTGYSGLYYSAQQAGAGKQGCGGNGGGGGYGGHGGGSSIGVYASAAHVDIQASALVPGAGGGGGDGSSGKAGGAGSAGAVGDAVYCATSCCFGNYISCSTIIILPPVQAAESSSVAPALCPVFGCSTCMFGGSTPLAGGASTGGANGGTGGKGGGGAGGDSYAIVKVAGGVVTTSNTTLSHGAVGSGGTGANLGAVGVAGDIYE